jgi:toxin ParE1/3/4
MTPAKRDVAAIRTRIARDDPVTADRFVLRLYDHMVRIAALGNSGVPRDNIRPGLRLAVHGNYNIYFRVTPTETIIVRVVHSARDARRLSFHEDPAPPIWPVSTSTA